ncbi:2-succinyl-6-hydroxy-2,4-cyclohexadiene-1-carboxylate synthase [Psychromonas algicola]|uniref:2-succinyl-6-hydroxy-2, 4-cyclohexadiene-1-carboxylate synthase n=1 Tax=Psychromonas algicola TaxID=2555642 RepID=UPI0010689ACC|nr:2-succinyl-6-hydroxy-2,4-cyclohexadiene-1-carboxylate synthase [Psychromonas sp. RZ5]TEW48502.1 2-succinyl-6-hydroxy-2,4-cyclohexadiene-1-carboxylate synthase [Psychromonas sp. RZ5]
MPLYYEQQGSNDNPTLVFLHGFLGNCLDWHTTIEQLKSDFHCVCIDLPGHGNSSAIDLSKVDGFANCHQLIKYCLNELNIQSFVFVGYSLGGRIALDYARSQNDPRLKHLILESTHLGLDNDKDKMQRYQSDLIWAECFATQSIEDSLYDWYDQTIFDDLSDAEKGMLIETREDNYGVYLANMLLATSLSHQQCARQFIATTDLPISYCYGEKDSKFKEIADSLPQRKNLVIQGFAGLGHNTHIKKPIIYANNIKQILR